MTTSAKFSGFLYFLEYIALRAVRALFLMLPLEASSWMMGKLWRLFARFNSRHRRVLRHLDWALGGTTSLAERHQIAFEMWENLGRTFIEALLLDKFIANRERVSVTPSMQKIMDEALSQSAIFVGHHFGNWELNALPAREQTDYRLMGLYKRVKNPVVDRWIKAQRQQIYTGGLFSAEDRPARKILAKIRNGVGCAMLGDLRDAQGVNIRFFNMPMRVSAFPASVAIRLGVPLYVVQIRRQQGAYFLLDIARIDPPDISDKDEQTKILTQAVHTQFEIWIKERPAQWMWAPHRWRGRRDGTSKPHNWTDYKQKHEEGGERTP